MTAHAKPYRAFISYSRRDERTARRLHAALEAYRAPRGIAAHVDHKTRRLGRFFRDDDEMPACHSLGASIERALDQAEALIVICSPHSARSAWVDMEVRRFRINPLARVFAVIVDGSPNADNPARECFCPGLRWRVASDGSLTDVLDEPLAPDLRREGLERTVTRLAAGLLGVGFETLWRRHARRTLRRRALSVSLSTLCAVALSGLLLGLDQRSVATSIEGMASHAETRLQAAHQSGDITDIESAIRLGVLVTKHPSTTDIGADFLTKAVAATRTEWRFSDLSGPVSHVAFADDGKTLMTLSENGRATLINLTTGQEVTRLDLNGLPLSISRDGRHILVTAPDGALVWRTDTWKAIALPGPIPICGTFSETTGLLITCHPDGGAQLWSAHDGRMISEIATDGTVMSAARFDTTGEHALLSAGHGLWLFWDTENGETRATMQYQGRNVAWKAAGIYNYFVSGFGAPPFGAVITPAGVAPLSGHDAPVLAAVVSGQHPANMRVASTDQAGRLVVANIAQPVTHSLFDVLGHDGPVHALAVSADMKIIATGGADGVVRVWSLQTIPPAVRKAIQKGVNILDFVCASEGHHFPHDARLITKADADALPHLRAQIGHDVCEALQ
ncbi:MAG: toll/interleukin-1 receptor domain-containing protein [Pikeienuella sp.]